MNRLLPILSAALLLLAGDALAADIKLSWTNGDNPGATVAWQTIIYIGTTSSNYTSQVTVQWPTTQCTVTNLQAGKRYYFTVAHTDLEDVSDKSNEVSAKTKMNPPKTLIVIP